jgi:type 1 glutamine amidotransferase
MPKGLIDTLSKEEIFDLVAYLRAGGNPLSPIYVTTGAVQSQNAVEAGQADDQPWISYPGGDGIGSGKHIVLVSGDEEYRSEEGLPQLAKIFSTHFGFQTTVLFAIDKQTGEINPDVLDNIPNLQAVDKADLLVIATRMRKLPDDQMKHLVDYIEAGKPIVAMRTATHAFDSFEGSSYKKYGFQNKSGDYEGGFGRQVLGETWISHHGKHKFEATRGIVADHDHPIARGLKPGDIFGPTDVYGVRLPLPGDSHPIVLGAILTGMNPDDEVVKDDRNDPMMPIAWTRTHKGGRTFTTTMGAATDLVSEGVRRMIVNGALWTLKLENEIKPDLDVSIVGEFKPTPYGFGDYIKGKKPADYR